MLTQNDRRTVPSMGDVFVEQLEKLATCCLEFCGHELCVEEGVWCNAIAPVGLKTLVQWQAGEGVISGDQLHQSNEYG